MTTIVPCSSYESEVYVGVVLLIRLFSLFSARKVMVNGSLFMVSTCDVMHLAIPNPKIM
jgi:hypothetical protein